MSQSLPRVHFPCLFYALTTLTASGLDWQARDGHRLAALSIDASSGKAGFTQIDPAISKISFTNHLSDERGLTNQILLNGSGVAAGDIDSDGRCDLYFCGLESANALYRNLGGWRFEEITAAAGVQCGDQASTGAAFADVDGDGDLDLLVNGIRRGTRLFLNNGHGKFSEFTGESGLRGMSGSASLTLADIDGDGLLDIYVVNYRNDTMRDMPDIRFRVGVTNGVYHLLSVNGQAASAPQWTGRFSIESSSSVLENGEADRLFRNLGQGRFTSLSWTNGTFLDEQGAPVPTPYDWGLSAMFHDVNGDGAPDLYVCNDFQSPDRIWINDGHGRFRAPAREALPHTSLFSMGVDFADIDRDGYDDFFVGDMLSREHAARQVQVMGESAYAQARRPTGERPQVPHNTLFLNRRNGTYAEIARLSGLDASDWSWCPAFLDVDLDGYEDLLVTTGHWRDMQNADVAREIEHEKRQRPMPPLEQLRLRRRFPLLNTPNAAFRNRGDLTFEDVSRAWSFDSRRISHGLALADLDQDGDLDVIINCLNEAPLLYRNEATNARLSVRLRGRPPNTKGIGARVRVSAPGIPLQSAEFKSGGRYLSSDDAIRTFAAGSEGTLVTVEVLWRGGHRTVVSNLPPNHILEIDESSSQPIASKPVVLQKKFFEDVSHLLKHEHRDEPFDDFARQPLLPHELSNLGPGVTWFDFNDDGWDDLLIGGGRGGRMAAFRNDGAGGLIPQRSRLIEGALQKDLTTVLGWRPNTTNVLLLAGVSTYEESRTNSMMVRELSLVTGADHLMNLSGGAAGPLALGDFDSDGDLDLFVGGRAVPGRYPEAASSALLRNEKGQLQFDAEASHAFSRLGMVNSAMFSDLDGDGRPELVLACEWGPLRIFRERNGQFEAWNAPIRPASSGAYGAQSLHQLTGWWNSVAAGDFDSDGRLDLVAGNWGRNTSRQRFLREPLRVYFGEVDGNVAVIEAQHDPAIGKWVPARDWGSLTQVLPILQGRYPDYASFARATMSDVLAAGLPPMQELTVQTLDSVLLLNRTNYFEVRALPIEAQFSVVFGITVGDLNGDGAEDLFLAQNFSGLPHSESPLDAGCGVWLRGDGKGGFSAVPPGESGIAIHGEGRGTALSDFDHDGRLDLVVGQNSGPTKFYRNLLARPGLRVRLKGSAENLQAAGALIRLEYASGRHGPAHELRIGSGYWSQDSSEILLGFAEKARALEIRWPGGFTERIDVPQSALTITRTLQEKR